MLDLLNDIERELGGHPEELNEAERLEAEESRRNVLRMLQALALTTLILFAFSSDKLVTWVNGFEVGPVQDLVVSGSSRWDEWMADIGFTLPAEAARERVNHARAMDWAEVRRWIERESSRTREGVRLLRGAVAESRG